MDDEKLARELQKSPELRAYLERLERQPSWREQIERHAGMRDVAITLLNYLRAYENGTLDRD